MALLDVRDLKIAFYDTTPPTEVVKGISFSLEEGETLGIVGESGSGKTQTALSILHLLKENSAVSGGEILYEDSSVAHASSQDLQRIRGKEISMIFQEPMTSLNPVKRIGWQIEESLRIREFEPDAPNYTPRISGVMHIENGRYNYAMSILKSNNGNPESCNRYTFAYENPAAGEGHFIHTYMCDSDPLPSFEGEPKLIQVPDSMEEFTELLWNSLNQENKVSLFVRYIDIETGKYETKIVNKNQK